MIERFPLHEASLEHPVNPVKSYGADITRTSGSNTSRPCHANPSRTRTPVTARRILTASRIGEYFQTFCAIKAFTEMGAGRHTSPANSACIDRKKRRGDCHDRPFAGQWNVDHADRREFVQLRAGEGLPNRVIACAVGTSEGTVRNDLNSGAQDYAPEPGSPEAITEGPIAATSTPITGIDNKTHPRLKPRRKPNPKPVVTDDGFKAEPVYKIKQGTDAR